MITRFKIQLGLFKAVITLTLISGSFFLSFGAAAVDDEGNFRDEDELADDGAFLTLVTPPLLITFNGGTLLPEIGVIVTFGAGDLDVDALAAAGALAFLAFVS